MVDKVFGADNVIQCEIVCSYFKGIIKKKLLRVTDHKTESHIFSLHFIDMKCEPIGSIQYGEVTVLPYNKFAAIARYQCHEGYEIYGKHQRVRVCQGDGQWSLSPPECRININQSIQGM